MKIDVSEFRIAPGAAVDLAAWPTRIDPFHASRREYRRILEEQVAALSDRQALLYAHDRYALLLIFQAMDAAGKDSTIRHVMSGVNPQGCQVYSFKHPSAAELDHDFLWRTNQCLPERGRIGIFNRSYYEEVLVVRVHPQILRAQALPPDAIDVPDFWQRRFESINDLERHLHRNGTRIVKFFLHLSRDEQRRRFLSRLDEPHKHWKFSRADIAERAHWPSYMHAYAECLTATSTAEAPWYAVPADDKENARLIVAQVIIEALEALEIGYPAPTIPAAELQAIRGALNAEP